ncbi:MAG: hypothetical protein IJ214_07080 [Clostridia bacterium]|nr:hypothetical protein [Clostridia bacterium]
MRKVIKAFILTIIFYLFQVCVMQHLKIYGVVGNLLAVNIAVATVSLGKKYAFGASCLSGILLEAMTSSVGGLYVVLYPVFGMLFAQVFADMSDEKREKLLLRQSDNGKKIRGDMNPHFRIPLDAMCIAAGIEAVCLIYVTLSGTDISYVLFARSMVSVLYTGVLALVLMFPARAYLHMYGGRIRRATVEEKQEERA